MHRVPLPLSLISAFSRLSREVLYLFVFKARLLLSHCLLWKRLGFSLLTHPWNFPSIFPSFPILAVIVMEDEYIPLSQQPPKWFLWVARNFRKGESWGIMCSAHPSQESWWWVSSQCLFFHTLRRKKLSRSLHGSFWSHIDVNWPFYCASFECN